jgi:beta-glucanase (GH16 family)
MLKSSRRAAVIAAVVALAISGSAGAAVAATAVAHNTTAHTCPSPLTRRQINRDLMAMLRHDVQRRYPPALRQRVLRRLTAHPALAYRLVARWSPARFAAVTCRVAATPATPTTVPATTSLTSFPTTVTPQTTTSGISPAGVPGNWHLSWSDDFAGPALDTTKWSTGWFGNGVTVPVNSFEQECYDPSQVAVSGGNLNLTAIAKPQTVNGKTYPYSSGIVTTMGKFTFTHGVVEARIYLSGSNAKIDNWPAFWADGTGSWPMTGELDVMEGLGGSAAYHFHSPAGGPGSSVAGNFTGWHTYAADWQPGVVTYYYDGNEVGQITTGITSSPMYLILNDAVAGQGGSVVAPSTMQVDYVRVWQ